MNKLGLMLGAAVVVAIAGCQDPKYMAKHGKGAAQNQVQSVETQPVAPETVEPVGPVQAPEKDIKIVTEPQHCTCPAGTVHPEPCGCGAPDCACKVLPPPPPPEVKPVPPPPPATTTYIVQRGDTLSKISKKFNIKIAAIQRANPKMKGDVVRIGQKIQLPGQVEVGAQTAPAGSFAPPPPKPAYKPYAGATKDYKVQNGDSLGFIAKKNGISTRQLKDLNNLSSDTIRIGQTLKVPAEKVVPPPPKAPAKPEAKKPEPPKAPVAPTPVAPVVAEEKHCTCPEGTVHTEPCTCGAPDCQCKVEPAAEAAAPAPEAPKPEGQTHVVREGEDLTSLSILYSLTPSEIRSYNNLGETEELKPGQVIKLPADTQL